MCVREVSFEELLTLLRTPLTSAVSVKAAIKQFPVSGLIGRIVVLKPALEALHLG
jgi:hypothetical protein